MIIKSFQIEKDSSNYLKYNFFLFYGENYGLQKDIKEDIKKKLNEKDKNIEHISFFENDIIENEDNFYNSVYSGSLFAEKKIITIKNTTDKLFSKIEDIVTKNPNNLFLIIFSEILEKKSKLRAFFEKNQNTICVPCYPDNHKSLEIIANNELFKNKLSLSREAINLLIEKSNESRNSLKNEIEKIKLYGISKKKIDIEEVRSIINFSGEYKSDNLINECLSGNILQYKKILSEIYENTINQIFFLRILSNKIRRLISIKQMMKSNNDIDNLLNSSKPPIFWKDKPIIKKQLMIWPINELTKTIYKINDTELLCKKNPQLSKIIFFQFFNEICRKASNFS